LPEEDISDILKAISSEAVELIYALDAGFIQKKTGQTKEVFDLSSVVARPGLPRQPTGRTG